MNGRLHPEDRFDRADIDLMFWLSAFAAAALFLLRFGYDFGVSDQDEFLPWLVHMMEPAVLAGDWFVGIQDASFNVRTVFVHALLPLARVLGTDAAVHVVYAVTFAGICLGIYRIGLGLHRGHPVLAAAGVVLAVAVTARWNPGGNDVAASVLAPSMTAWACALNGIATVLRGRLSMRRGVLAAILVSLATAFQALVGLQTAALLVVIVVVSEGMRRRSVWLFVGLLAIGTLLTVVPILAGSGLFDAAAAGGPGPVSGASMSPVEILAGIRAPHHYLPSAFGPGRWVRLWIVAAAGITFLWRRPDLLDRTVRKHAALLIGVVLCALLVFRVLIGLDPEGPAVLAQPFKMTVLLRVLCAVAAVGWIYRLEEFGRLAVTSLAIPTLLVIFGLYTGVLDTDRLFPFTGRSAGPVGEMHTWIVDQTSDDAVVAVPPAHTGFSFATRRAQYVNFKAVPYSDEDLAEWLRRLRTIAPFEPGPVGGTALLEQLERSYHGLHPTQLRAVMTAEGIDYIVARRGEHFAWPTADASYCNEDWCVYSVEDLNSIDEWRYATD